MKSPAALIAKLCSYRKRSEWVFNPWAEACAFDRDKQEFKQRQARLAKHLALPRPRFLLIGEAAGYQGCRYSGITFTSEKILLNEGIPRLARLAERVTHGKLPFCEPSATIVWGALRDNGLADQVILWNAFPFHPMRPDGIHTNRTPTRAEIEDGAIYLAELLSLYPKAPQLVAVGKKAEAILQQMGLKPVACLRHPAFGGAGEFREGLKGLS